MDREIQSSIVFFDDVCNLCNGFVDFLVHRDSEHRFRYASLQGETSRALLGTDEAGRLSSVVFRDGDGKVLRESDAVLSILILLGGAWRIAFLLRIIPRFVRDGIYHFIARNRYRWFGKREICRLPTAEERKLFLD